MLWCYEGIVIEYERVLEYSVLLCISDPGGRPSVASSSVRPVSRATARPASRVGTKNAKAMQSTRGSSNKPKSTSTVPVKKPKSMSSTKNVNSRSTSKTRSNSGRKSTSMKATTRSKSNTSVKKGSSRAPKQQRQMKATAVKTAIPVKRQKMLVKKQAKRAPATKPSAPGARRIAAINPTNKAAKIRTVGRKGQVFRGTCIRTSGGLKREDLIRNKRGVIVSKRKSELGKKNAWMKAVAAARKDLGVENFVKIKKDTAFYTTIYLNYAKLTGKTLPTPLAKKLVSEKTAAEKGTKRASSSKPRSKSKSKSN